MPIVHTSAGSTNVNTVTTTAIDTTSIAGGVLAVIGACGSGVTFAAGNITDSASNTWTLDRVSGTATSPIMGFWSVLTPNTNASHTFTFTPANTGTAPAMFVIGSSGFGTRDQTNTSFANAVVSLASGNTTPSFSNELWIIGLGWQNSTDTTASLDSGFTVVETLPLIGGQHYGGAIGYLIQGTAAALNPTWTWATSANGQTVTETFRAVVGAAPSLRERVIAWPVGVHP